MQERMMTYTNEVEGALKEIVKKQRGASRAMNIGTTTESNHPI